MAYVATDKDGSEWVFKYKSDRDARIPIWLNGGNYTELPKGSIAKLIGREITWDDEPVELVEDKPQKVEHDFKVGDIVRYKAPTPNDYCDNEILIISEIQEDCFAFFEDYEKGYHVRVLEHWAPMLNEWCWFWDEGLTHSAHLMQFHSKHEVSNGISYFGVSSYTKDKTPYTPQYQYCEPFRGTLPLHLQDKQ